MVLSRRTDFNGGEMMTVEEFLAEWNNNSDSVAVHSSGSTGTPKLMMAEKRRMEASARMTCKALGLSWGDKALVCLPMDYIAGKMMVVRCVTCGLDMLCVEPSGHPLATVSSNIDFAAMVPMQVFNSLEDDVERQRLMAVGNLLIGGGAIDEQLETTLREFPNAVWSSYGMTETLSHIALRRLDGEHASLWYRPLEGVRVSLDGNGCLVISAPAVCGQELHTHDLAIVEDTDHGQRFRITGRIDNVICSGGVKIQIEEVEDALRQHLSSPFMITRRPSEKFGEEVVMLTEDADTDAVLSVCRRVLPRYSQPKACRHVDRLPLTATGKPARSEAEKIWKQP